jgi:hypothetical protein
MARATSFDITALCPPVAMLGLKLCLLDSTSIIIMQPEIDSNGAKLCRLCRFSYQVWFDPITLSSIQ